MTVWLCCGNNCKLLVKKTSFVFSSRCEQCWVFLPFLVNPFSGEELGKGRCVFRILRFPADQLSPACTSKAVPAQVGVLTRTEPCDDRESKAFVGLCDWGKSAHFSFFCSPPACLWEGPVWHLSAALIHPGLVPVLCTKAVTDFTTALAHKENIFLPKELAVLLAGCSTCTVICQRAEGVLDMQVSSGIA